MRIPRPISGLLSKVASVRNKRVAIMSPTRRASKEVLDRELDRLIAATLEIEQDAEWAASPRGQDFVAAVTEEVTRLQMQLPDAVLTEQDTAIAMAAMIKSYANVLRIFNSPVLEYEGVRRLVDKRLSSIGDENA